ncbi:MAG: DUF952 domain-containing protein [Acidobacteria bacterium]|nr:DUF952 domain-containing protein [Acidobacteriota bacterium]
MLIYHVTLPETWEYYKGRPSYQAESLQTEGFIHCSYEKQLEGTLQRYFANASKVVILKIETDKLFAKLVEEASTGDEVFPHIYGRLNHSAIVSAELRDLKLGAAR